MPHTHASTSHESLLPPSGPHGIIPPHVLRRLAESREEDAASAARHALATLELTERLRTMRAAPLTAEAPPAPLTAEPRREVHDARHRTTLPGPRVRNEGDPPTRDAEADEAYDAAGATYTFYERVFARDSVDGHGMRLVSSVHFSERFDNAFWNGAQMVYGDGDGIVFNRFTSCLEVIGHELTHGVTQATANLEYSGQSGALNESYSDVFGSLVRQYARGETAEQADWLIGAGLFTKSVHGVALRSLKAPGTAYDDRRLGRDPQPAHMRDYVHTLEDQGGVHFNSGIPNHAFYLAAIALGGHAWERAGAIWYGALCTRLTPRAQFADAATATIAEAHARLGDTVADVVRRAWEAVGVKAAAQRAA